MKNEIMKQCHFVIMQFLKKEKDLRFLVFLQAASSMLQQLDSFSYLC